jgi:high-affinity iron transporter
MRLSFVILVFVAAMARADVIDDHGALQQTLDEASLDLHGGRWSPGMREKVESARKIFGRDFVAPESLSVWNAPFAHAQDTEISAALALGELQARLQHAAALEMLWHQHAGQIEAAREWRTIIKLPKYTNSVEGTLALQHLGGDSTQRDEVSRLLAREYVIWQITRAREKADALARLVQDGRATPALINARVAEVQGLSEIPPSLLTLATQAAPSANSKNTDELSHLLAAGTNGSVDSRSLLPLVTAWRLALEKTYPNLLTAEDAQRRERILLKLLRLVPKEYQSGVRDGEIIIPLEYRHAKRFTIQSKQIVNELLPVWRDTKPGALEKHGPELLASLDGIETALNKKTSQGQVEDAVAKSMAILKDDFGLSLRRAGTASDVVTETAIEIQSLLGESLAAAQAGQWRKAEASRLDAYVSFDLEIEKRTLPRDPTLARRSERAFLDGDHDKPGIKAALDSRLSGDELTAAYQRALDGLDECTALAKVGLSPTAAAISTTLIVVREGLEAVVILAALLAGLRGAENAGIRRRIGAGAWLAIAASIALFAISRTLLQGLARYGETLEAVISVIAVVILLMVTNWVFHKYYWTGWNARLRDLSKAAQRQQATRWENLALVGVGFMTIFREGFETTLFMQSLILEASMKAVLAGLAVGGLLIAILGFAVFAVGAKLPYRKMLVVTGVLVIFVLFTFLGSTVRLFQTVGWLPVHPIPGLELPVWTGVWLGIYPTWEGLLIPFAAFGYVGAMWLWVKFSSQREQMKEIRTNSRGSLNEAAPKEALLR